jgi:superfamily II DNA or RNA helicase
MSVEDFEYDIEINELAPRAEQPEKIKIPLKAHQLACLYKAMKMEKIGKVEYNIKEETPLVLNRIPQNYYDSNIRDKVSVSSNIGILGDIVGYGKTLTALAIIAASKLEDIYINKMMHISYSSSRNNGYLSYSAKNNSILENNNIIKSTLIIVPRGPVYVQWEKSLKDNTSLKYLAIDNLLFIKKYLPEYKEGNYQKIIDFFNQYDVVLIKNTTLDILISYYTTPQDIDYFTRIPFIKRWKRLIIDEAHDICNKIPLMYYDFLWLISGTYENILYSIRSYNHILYYIRDAFNHNTKNLILVKCKKEFVRESFKIPVPVERHYICKLNAMINAVKKFMSPEMLERINANDIAGIVRDLGGKNDTENNVIELVCKEINREIKNKQKEREYILGLDIPADSKANRLKNIDSDLAMNTEKLADLKQRVSEITSKMCSKCMSEIEGPIVLECTHSYCGVCIVRWLEKNMKCPECRHSINVNNMIAVVDGKNKIVNNKNAAVKDKMSKEDTLLDIIKSNPNGKYLVFSKYDSTFFKVTQLLNANDVSFSELKGNTAHMINILDKFKTGQLQVILLNTNFAGSGIDISYATDVIIYHSMGTAKHQAIGRAQRVGRKDVLNIHYLCYEHELLE